MAVLIRHLWQLKKTVFLHWCLICAVLLWVSWRPPNRLLKLRRFKKFFFSFTKKVFLVIFLFSEKKILSHFLFIFLFRHLPLNMLRWEKAGKSHWRRRISTVDLLVLTSLNQLLFIMQILFTFLLKKLSYSGGQPYWTFPFCKSSLGKSYKTILELYTPVTNKLERLYASDTHTI